MTQDEGGETGERKQTATVVEKGQGGGAREKIKNRGEGVESYALWWGPRGAGAFSLTQMMKKGAADIYLSLMSRAATLRLLPSLDKWCSIVLSRQPTNTTKHRGVSTSDILFIFLC